jgi:hypothetical protein
MEAHGFGVDAWYDRAKQTIRMQTGRPTALRLAIQACRKGGTLSIPVCMVVSWTKCRSARCVTRD